METVMDETHRSKGDAGHTGAFNHEFLNKLHVILSYLQTGQTEEAIRFIINSNLVSSQSIRQTADCIRVSKICALVIGKMMHAAELGILLTVSPTAGVLKDLLLPMEDYITIIGNLLENAIEELSNGEHEIKEITLGLYCDPDCNIITCEDTGSGIRPDLIDRIYERGSHQRRKPRNRTFPDQTTCRRIARGYLHQETEEGEGTCFTHYIYRKGKPSCTM